jgi:putative endonuclease
VPEDPRPRLGVNRLGADGEDAALAVYVRRGYRVVARNWRCRLGELDLVLARDDTLVVCEVKTRRGSAFGGGFEAVTGRKRAKVRSVAEAFLQSSRARPRAVRFDVASVSLGPRGAEVELFEDAF